VIEPKLSIAVLDKPIRWNDDEVDLVFLYIKILVSEQGNAVCEKLSNCHNLLIMRNDKKDYRNSQHFAFAF
jgi:mannitol/fructose-specific phosphotransferase system IIA component (Ntr-type)